MHVFFEQFAPCIFSLGGLPLRFFSALRSQIQEAARRRELTQTALSSGARGSLVALPPRGKVGGSDASGAWVLVGPFLRWVRVDPSGWGLAVAALRQRTQTRNVSTHEKGACHHMHHSMHTESALHSRAPTHARRATASWPP